MINNISNTYSPNFNGTFVVKFPKSVPGLQEAFEQSIKPNRFHKFENVFGEQGKIMYVLRESADLGAAKFLDKNSVRGVVYYPTVTTTVIPSPNVKAAENFITNENPLQIKSISKIIDYINQNLQKYVAQSNAVNKKLNKAINPTKIAQKFNFDIVDFKYIPQKGLTEYKGLQGSEMLISPATGRGNRYIFLKPKIGHGDTKHYLVNSQGEVIKDFKTPDEITAFQNGFSKAIDYHKSISFVKQ